MRNVVQLCFAANNVLLMRKWNHAFLILAIALAWKWQIASLPEDIPYKNKPGNRMIKQLLNSVIAKYRELSVASRSIVNCSCLCCVFYFRGMGRHSLGLNGKVMLNVTVTVLTSSFSKLPKISDSIKQHRVNAVISYERTLGTRWSRTNNNDNNNIYLYSAISVAVQWCFTTTTIF